MASCTREQFAQQVKGASLYDLIHFSLNPEDDTGAVGGMRMHDFIKQAILKAQGNNTLLEDNDISSDSQKAPTDTTSYHDKTPVRKAVKKQPHKISKSASKLEQENLKQAQMPHKAVSGGVLFTPVR